MTKQFFVYLRLILRNSYNYREKMTVDRLHRHNDVLAIENDDRLT